MHTCINICTHKCSYPYSPLYTLTPVMEPMSLARWLSFTCSTVPRLCLLPLPPPMHMLKPNSQRDSTAPKAILACYHKGWNQEVIIRYCEPIRVRNLTQRSHHLCKSCPTINGAGSNRQASKTPRGCHARKRPNIQFDKEKAKLTPYLKDTESQSEINQDLFSDAPIIPGNSEGGGHYPHLIDGNIKSTGYHSLWDVRPATSDINSWLL